MWYERILKNKNSKCLRDYTNHNITNNNTNKNKDNNNNNNTSKNNIKAPKNKISPFCIYYSLGYIFVCNNINSTLINFIDQSLFCSLNFLKPIHAFTRFFYIFFYNLKEIRQKFEFSKCILNAI